MPCDFFTHAILPYLTPDQIDEMGFYNRGLSKLISRKRVNLPRTPVNKLEIHESEKITTNYDVDIEVVDDNYMVHIKHLQPKCLELIGDVQYENLDERWLKTVETVNFDEIDGTAEDFYKIFQKFNSPSIRISNFFLKLDAGKILELMPSLTELEMNCVSIPAKFYEDVVRKSNLGNGIHSISLVNAENSPFDAGQLLHIIENAKFNTSSHRLIPIAIDYVTGTHDQFVEKLTELTRKMGWTYEAFYDFFTHDFEISIQFSWLSVQITFFNE